MSKRGSIRVGVDEVEGSVADHVGAALEVDAAALDLGVAEEHGRVARAPQLEVGAGIEAREVVVDAQGAGGRAPGHRGSGPRRSTRARLLGRAGGQDLGGHVVAAGLDRLADVEGAGHEAAALVAEEAEVGVDQAAQSLGPAQGQALATRPEVERGQSRPPRRRPGLRDRGGRPRACP